MLDRIGAAVRAGRVSSALSVETLAERAKLTPDQVEGLEAGASTVSTAALRRIALVLDLDPDALLEGREVVRRPVVAFFRQNATPDLHAEDVDRFQLACTAARDLAMLRSISGRPTPQSIGVRPRRVGPDPTGEGIALAREVRETLGLGAEPIRDLVSLIADQLGVFLVAVPLTTTQVIAVSLKNPADEGAAIVLNASHRHFTDRQIRRATLAHELCHALFDPVHGQIGVRLDREDASGGQSGAPHEVRARAFLANLLVPDDGVHDAIEGEARVLVTEAAIAAVERIRRTYKVSADVAMNRLLQLRRIERYVYDNLRARADWAWIDMPDREVPVAADPRRALKAPVLEALRNSEISEMRAKELLGLSVWDDLAEA